MILWLNPGLSRHHGGRQVLGTATWTQPCHRSLYQHHRSQDPAYNTGGDSVTLLAGAAGTGAALLTKSYSKERALQDDMLYSFCL